MLRQHGSDTGRAPVPADSVTCCSIIYLTSRRAGLSKFSASAADLIVGMYHSLLYVVDMHHARVAYYGASQGPRPLLYSGLLLF